MPFYIAYRGDAGGASADYNELRSQESMISIIVPCYNEQEALPFFHEEISRVLKEIGEDYELLFVNDGSKDDTLKELKALSTMDPDVIYLSF